MNINNPVPGDAYRDLINQHIRHLSDGELESLAAHADFYRRQLQLPPDAGWLLVYAVLLSVCRREQSTRPEDLVSAIAFKYYLKRVIRFFIDSARQKPEIVPAEFLAHRFATRRERKQFRGWLRDACANSAQPGQTLPTVLKLT